MKSNAKTVKEYKAGKVEFRNDDYGIVHAVIGKISFAPEKIAENFKAFVEFIHHIKPNAVRGQYVKTISISATMSPGIRIAT